MRPFEIDKSVFIIKNVQVKKMSYRDSVNSNYLNNREAKIGDVIVQRKKRTGYWDDSGKIFVAIKSEERIPSK